MATKTQKPAEDLHPDYDIGFEEGRECAWEEACDAFIASAPNRILEALRKSGGRHGDGIEMHVPMDWDVIRATLREMKIAFINPESLGTGVDPAGSPE